MYESETIDRADVDRWNKGFKSLRLLYNSPRPNTEIRELSKLFGVKPETAKGLLEGKSNLLPASVVGFRREDFPDKSSGLMRLYAGLLSVEPLSRKDTIPDGMPRVFKSLATSYETAVYFAEGLERDPESVIGFPKHVRENWIEYSITPVGEGYLITIVWLYYPKDSDTAKGILAKDRKANAERIEKARKKKGFKASDYKAFAEHIHAAGYFANGYCIPETGVILAEKSPFVDSYVRMALELSELTGGTWYQNGDRLVWTFSRSSVAIHTVDTYAEVIRARETAKAILGRESEKKTVSSLARELLEWIDPEPETPNRELVKTNISGGKQYLYCSPKVISDAKHIDITSAYYTTLSRFPTEKPTGERDGKIIWKKPDESTERFRQAVSAIAPDKILRNALVGTMSRGMSGKMRVFVGGRSKEVNTGMSPWADTGTLVWRTMNEVMRDARKETNAALSIVDCLICDSDATPKTWERYNLPYKTVSRGEADIHSVVSFRVGNRATIPYTRQWNETHAIEEEETGINKVAPSVLGTKFAV